MRYGRNTSCRIFIQKGGIRERDVRLKRQARGWFDTNFDEYRYIVGEIRGMAYVEEELRTAMKGIEYADD